MRVIDFAVASEKCAAHHQQNLTLDDGVTTYQYIVDSVRRLCKNTARRKYSVLVSDIRRYAHEHGYNISRDEQDAYLAVSSDIDEVRRGNRPQLREVLLRWLWEHPNGHLHVERLFQAIGFDAQIIPYVVNETINYARLLLVDHERHDIEDEFQKFLQNIGSGYWHLVAGPGMGKTAIFANILMQLRESPKISAVGHFFRSDGAAPAGNDLGKFYDNIISYLLYHFRLDRTVPDRESDKIFLFRELLHLLSIEGQISTQNPLVIIVDALDEIGNSSASFHTSRNFLQLPQRLPEGVYIAISSRGPEGDVPINWSPSWAENYDRVEIDERSAKHYSMHINTTHRYVDRLCSSREYIGEYHQPFDQEDIKDTKRRFVKRISERAGYNIMILRSTLNDPDSWSTGDAIRMISRESRDLFRGQIFRVTKDDPESIARTAIYCLSLRGELSQYALLRLMTGPVDAGFAGQSVRRRAGQIIERWVDQGILVKENRNRSNWYRIYHSTFREFILDELRDQDLYEFLHPFALNLRGAVYGDGGYEFLKTQSADLIEEWCVLLIRLHLETESYGALRELLADFEFWDLASRAPGGVSNVLEALNHIVPRRQNAGDLTRTFELTSGLVLEWVSNGKLDPEYERRKGVGELYLMCQISGRVVGGGEWLSLSDFIFRSGGKVEESGRSSAGDVERLLSALKSARKQGDRARAEAHAREIEQKLSFEKRDAPGRSALSYEMAFLSNGEGRYLESVSQFRESARCAFEGGDLNRGLFSEHREYLAMYFAGMLPEGDLYQKMTAIYEKYLKLRSEWKGDPLFLEGNMWNVAIVNGMIAFDVAPNDFLTWHDILMDHPYTARGNANADDVHRYYCLQSEARVHYVYGRYAEAAAIFLSYLDGEVPGVKPVDVGALEGPLRRMAARDEFENCRDYRDLGRAIMLSGLPDARRAARDAWERGLAFADRNGVGVFQGHIREEISRLSQET